MTTRPETDVLQSYLDAMRAMTFDQRIAFVRTIPLTEVQMLLATVTVLLPAKGTGA